MDNSKITQKSDITEFLGARPLLPTKNAKEYASGLKALIAELDAETVLQIYIAEKISDYLWWISRYEAQKRMVMIVVMAEIVKDHYRARGRIDSADLREAIINKAGTAERAEAWDAR